MPMRLLLILHNVYKKLIKFINIAVELHRYICYNENDFVKYLTT